MIWGFIGLGIVIGVLAIFYWQARSKMVETFKALSHDVLKDNNQAFLNLAQTHLEKFQILAQKDLEQRQQGINELVKPVRESLERVDVKINEIEKSRARSEEGIQQQVKAMIDAQKELRQETSQLVMALRAPQARGRWGEIQLKRVVEMAGMLEYCDFTTQTSVTVEEGRLRPDLIVRLPAKKNIVVDAKVPLMAFLDALAVQDPVQKAQKFLEHARHVRRHIETLGRKSYWDQFSPAPEFVVLFLPGEHFFSAALEQDPTLIELGVTQNVIVATPTTLIALLRSVAYGWRQEKLAENARIIGDLGRDLYKRISDFGIHLSRVGKSLEASVDSYNKAVGSLETRVLVSARRFKDLEGRGQAGVQELDSVVPIDQRPRSLQAPEVKDVPNREN